MDSKREVILYVVFGVLTTAINIVTYLFCTKLLQIEYKLATTIAWIVSVLFAFVTNKLYVFRSKEPSMRFVLKEMFLFFIARLFSYGLDIGTMLLLVAQLHMNDFIAKMRGKRSSNSCELLYKQVCNFFKKSKSVMGKTAAPL
ncbi:hypothetical protein GCM10020331_080900 [Ectobacillus funiculus]